MPIAHSLAAYFPERVRGLMLVNGFARLVEDADFPVGVSRASREDFERSVAHEYGAGRFVERWLPELSHHSEVTTRSMHGQS